MKIFIITFFLSHILIAQDTVYTLQPVEITASRPAVSLQSFEMINRNDIQNSGTGLSLEESFAKIPGIIVGERYNPSLGDKISIRGIGTRASFGVRGVKILVDNIPLTLPDGQSQTNNIDFFSAGSVDILKGPASSLYGNAAGGVINFSTEFPDENIINASPEIIFGSYDLQKYSMKLSGKINSQSYLVSFNNLNFNGYREHSARKSYHLNSVYRNSIYHNFNLTAVLNYFDSPYLLNPGSLDKQTAAQSRTTAREINKLQGTGQNLSQLQTGLTLNFLDNNFNFETTLYFVKRDLVNPIIGRVIDLDRRAGGFRSFLSRHFIFNNMQLDFSGGIDLEIQNDFRKENVNVGLPHTGFSPADIFKNINYGNRLVEQEETVTGIGPFLTIKILLNDNWGLQSGLRYDYYKFKVDDMFTGNSGERKMDQLSPAAGLFFKPTQSSKIFLNYSTSFQTPTTSELSNRPDGEGGFNPELNPERIYQFESGTEYFSTLKSSKMFSGFGVRLSVYYLNFNDLIIPYQLTTSEEVFFRNAGKAENKGVEFIFETLILSNLKTTISFSVMDFIYKDYIIQLNDILYQLEGNKVPGVPQQNINIQLEYLSEAGINGRIKIYWSDKYYTNDFNGPAPGSQSPANNFINESYIKTDVRIGYRINFNPLSIELFTGINNLFDKKYNGSVLTNAIGNRYFEPAPERNWYAGLRIVY